MDGVGGADLGSVAVAAIPALTDALHLKLTDEEKVCAAGARQAAGLACAYRHDGPCKFFLVGLPKFLPCNLGRPKVQLPTYNLAPKVTESRHFSVHSSTQKPV